MSWTTHNLPLLDWDRYGTYAGTQQAMKTAIGGILRTFGHKAELFAPAARGRSPASVIRPRERGR